MTIASAQAEALARLRADAFGGDAAGWSAPEIERLANAPGAGMLVDRDEAPRGFVLFRIAADEAEILSIAVRPECQGAGIGAALLASAERTASERGARAMFLEAAASNSRACALYRRTGYVQIGCRRRYYAGANGHADDALILSKDL
jgi:ribosomal-protein-alanine N-acetyltransferase